MLSFKSFTNVCRLLIRYVDYLGCEGANLTDTDEYYARYTTSSICNGIVQSSKDDCNLSSEESRPLCADDCVCDAHQLDRRNSY